jgi:hypothetical protein
VRARLLVSCVMARKAGTLDFLMVIVTLRMNWRGAISLIFGVVGVVVVVVVGEDMVAVAVVGINGLGVECREAGTLTLLVLLL